MTSEWYTPKVKLSKTFSYEEDRYKYAMDMREQGGFRS